MYIAELNSYFIHIPKTGGESIIQALSGYTVIGSKHKLYSDYEKSEQGASRALFVFTIVRNPWEQVFSFYNHLRKPLYMTSEEISTNPGYFADGYHLNPIELCRSAIELEFPDWVRKWYSYGRPPEYIHLLPYFKWIEDRDGLIRPDYIIRFESINQDFAKVCEKIHIEAELPHINQSIRLEYKDFYSDEAVRIVQRLFQSEIDYFNYSY
jgi:chondroitin 4-sulfotransferase 11